MVNYSELKTVGPCVMRPSDETCAAQVADATKGTRSRDKLRKTAGRGYGSDTIRARPKYSSSDGMTAEKNAVALLSSNVRK